MDTPQVTLESMNVENIAETIARELKQPRTIESPEQDSQRHLLLPPGWKREFLDDENLRYSPRRLKAHVTLRDADSFIEYVNHHKPASEPDCRTIWCAADWKSGNLVLVAVLDDHAPGRARPSWREHLATYSVLKSAEWERWRAKDRQPFSQVDFAAFIEDGRRDIATVDGLPTGSQMFEMAVNMEANQDVRFKSAIRLQSGGTQLQFIADDDKQTVERMQLFERFAIGIPVLWNGDAYRIDARLKYRARDAKVTFWYELERADLVFESAAKALISSVREKTGVPFYFGDPGLK